eukprot:scaffold43248_cov31-Tisochrysis_lutea.AAC.3
MSPSRYRGASESARTAGRQPEGCTACRGCSPRAHPSSCARAAPGLNVCPRGLRCRRLTV